MSTTQMRIVLDIDGVLYQFAKTAQYMMARHLGYEYREELEVDESRFDWGLPKELWDWVWLPEQIDPLFRHGHLYRGAIEFARDLAKLGEVHLVTSRPGHATQVTIEWARFHWGKNDPFKRIHVIGENTPKSKVDADVYIDDQVRILAQVEGARILLTRPWNVGDNLNDHYGSTGQIIRRCDEYKDVLREVEDVARRLRQGAGDREHHRGANGDDPGGPGGRSEQAREGAQASLERG